MSKLLLAPNFNDGLVYASYTIMRANPDVVLLSEEGIDPEVVGYSMLGAKVKSLDIAPSRRTHSQYVIEFDNLDANFMPDLVFVPTSGPIRSLYETIANAAKEVWEGRVLYYSIPKEKIIDGDMVILPSRSERAVKRKIMERYNLSGSDKEYLNFGVDFPRGI